MVDIKKYIDPDELHKQYSRVNMYDARAELGYQVKRNGASMLVRRVADLGAHMIESSADTISSFITQTVGSFFQFFLGREIASNLGLFTGAVTNSVIGLASLGVAGAVSAGFAQMDHIHQKNNLRILYADEIGAKLGKPAASVTIRDLEQVAKDIPVLDEELRRTRKQRNFEVPLAIVATVASFAVVNLALPAVIGSAALTGFGGLLLRAAVSMAAYCAVKMPLQMVGSRVFGLHDETANDRIVDIGRAHEKGIEIKPQDLMPIAAQSNAKLKSGIIQQFGHSYNQLKPDQQEQAMQLASGLVPLEKLARDINEGAIDATELAFAAVGERSGMPRREVAAPDMGAGFAAPSHGKYFQDKVASSGRRPAKLFTERILPDAATEAAISL